MGLCGHFAFVVTFVKAKDRGLHTLAMCGKAFHVDLI